MKSFAAIAALAILVAAPTVRGETFPPAPPAKDAPDASDLAARMRTLVTTQCASCHEAGALAVDAHGFGAAFDLARVSLDELADDPGFVVRGFAEASPLFHALLSKHRISDLGTTAGLTGEEILAVRDWIQSLPPKAACTATPPADERVETADGGLLISLRHLADGCRAAGRIAEWRALADDIVAALTTGEARSSSVDANGTLLAVRSVPFDRLTGADLEALRELTSKGPVPLEELASFVIDRGLMVREDVRSRIAALARVARRTPKPTGELEVKLLSRKATAKVEELVSLDISVSKACHLTIVSIDPAGRALVLFPNEIEEENLVQTFAPRTVPGANAGYQVRFDKPGTETFLAHCQTGRTTFDGVKVDYEKQRFPVLGDWRGFLSVMDERQVRIEKEKQQGEGRRSRRRGRAPAEAKPAAAPVDPKSNLEGWAAIRITVE